MSPTQATRPTDQQPPAEQHTGISNRETPDEEAAEREEHPPVPDAPPPARTGNVEGAFGKEPRD